MYMRLKVAEQIKKYSSVTKEFDLLKLFNAKSCSLLLLPAEFTLLLLQKPQNKENILC